MMVTIVNPLEDGCYAVHAAHCADLRKYPKRSGWTIEADSRKAVAMDMYDPDCFESMDPDGANWRDNMVDVTFKPCVKALPDEVSK
jgi:hypothetical protein